MLLSGTLSTFDKQRIAYCHCQNGHNRVVVIVHGFYNSKDSVLLQELAKLLSDEYDIFLFDFRGHGKSSGAFSWTSKEGQDLHTVLNYLKDKYKKVAIIAFSLGGSVSINVVAERSDIHSLICVSVPSDIEKVDLLLIYPLAWL